MQKVLAIGAATSRLAPLPGEGRVVEFPATPERASRTFVCSVLFVDIVEYSKKPVAEQLQTKERFNARVSQALQEIPAEDRIVLDTGDGVAVSFLGDPEDALFGALRLARWIAQEAGIQVRMGINLGPVRLTRDINAQPNILGDGINVAQRVTSFAQPGQILVSRAYHEALTRTTDDYAALFAYQGSRTDKHVREHEIFELAAPAEQAHELAERRQRARRRKARSRAEETTPAAGLLARRGLALGVAGLSVLALVGALVLYLQPRRAAPPVRAAAAGPLVQARAPEAPAALPASVPVALPASADMEAKLDIRPHPAVAAPSVKPPSTARPARSEAKAVAAASEKALTAAPATPSGTDTARPATPSDESPPEAKVDMRPVGVTPWKVEAPAEAPPPQPVTPAPRAPAGPTALVRLAISPWGEVYVDGKSMGVSPPVNELEIPPGKHTIVVRNGSFKPYQEEVELGTNETFRIKHKFNLPR